MAKTKNIDELVDSADQFPQMSDVTAKKKTTKKAEKEAVENPAVAEHVKVAIPKKMGVKPEIQVMPAEKREKLPLNAMAPSSSVLDGLKEKRAKEKQAEHRAAQIVPVKNTGEIVSPLVVSDHEARIVALEHRLNNPLHKAS